MKDNIELFKKSKQCKYFLWTICVGGIVIPLLLLLLFVHEETTVPLTIICVLLAFIPTFFASMALLNYNNALSANSSDDNSSKKETNGNRLLYVGGLLSIILIALYVDLSGGIKDNLMAFYFVFLPSATAVAFNTRWGLILISGLSIGCVGLLYFGLFEHDFLGRPHVEMAEFKPLYSFLCSLYQIGLIILLEYFTNRAEKLSKNTEKLSKNNNDYENE